jgi:hypothetical protein
LYRYGPRPIDEDAPRSSIMELGTRGNGGAAEAEQAVAALHADARRGAAAPDLLEDELALPIGHLDAEPLPGELVGARGGEGGKGELDLLVGAVPAPREGHPRLAAILGCSSRPSGMQVAPVELRDHVATGEPASAAGLPPDLDHHDAASRRSAGRLDQVTGTRPLHAVRTSPNETSSRMTRPARSTGIAKPCPGLP